jgi:hypothetical protein
MPEATQQTAHLLTPLQPLLIQYQLSTLLLLAVEGAAHLTAVEAVREATALQLDMPLLLGQLLRLP